MGQYHTIYNKTKKQYLRIGGSKLWEQAHAATAAGLLLLLSNSNGRGGGDFSTYPVDYDKPTDQETANELLIEKIQGTWAGDEIVVQGDYAEKKDSGYIPESEMSDYENISSDVCAALLIADDGDNSEVAKIIERELECGFSSLKLSTVKKVKAVDRNKQTVVKYQAVASTKKPKTRKLKAV